MRNFIRLSNRGIGSANRDRRCGVICRLYPSRLSFSLLRPMQSYAFTCAHHHYMFREIKNALHDETQQSFVGLEDVLYRAAALRAVLYVMLAMFSWNLAPLVAMYIGF